MFVTPKDNEDWNSFDEDVKKEVVRLIKTCRHDSDMDDDDHPKNQQFSDAFSVIVGILES